MFVDNLRNQFQSGVVDAQYLEDIATLLEETAKTIRQIYGGTGDKLMDAVRQKAKIEVKDEKEEEQSAG